MMVREGHKRSLNVSLDFVDPKQRLYGYKTLNLLNSHEDPTFLHTVLYLQIARNYIPAPKANFVKVVINGESWGLYVNAQQFDKIFLAESFPSSQGHALESQGQPRRRRRPRLYRRQHRRLQAPLRDQVGRQPVGMEGLIALCKTLNQTPLDRLEEALKPILDIDGALWFLALDNALVNNDGYWVRASDYSIFRDQQGKFHIIPHDTNETFQSNAGFGPPGGGFGRGGPGFGRGGARPGGGPGSGPGGGPGPWRSRRRARPRPGANPGGGGRPSGIELDPLVGLNDARKPLRSRLLAVPALKARYLDHVRTIAEDWLDWNKLKPVVDQYRSLIEKEVEADTRKLTSFAAFQKSVGDAALTAARSHRAGGRASASRRLPKGGASILLNYPGIKNVLHSP